jgi:hypothetical protein
MYVVPSQPSALHFHGTAMELLRGALALVYVSVRGRAGSSSGDSETGYFPRVYDRERFPSHQLNLG